MRLRRMSGLTSGKEMMARATGLEPATSGVTGRHSNQLSYARANPRRRVTAMYECGAGPVKQGWRAGRVVGGDGIEPPTLSV